MGRFQRRKNITAIQPIASIEEQCVVQKDGSVVLGYVLEGFEVGTQAKAEQEKINRVFAALLKGFPPGVTIELRHTFFDQQVREVPAQEEYFLNKHLQHLYHRAVVKHQCHLYLSLGHPHYPSPNPVNNSFSSGWNLFKHPLKGIQARMAQAHKIANDMRQSLQGYQLGLRLMSGQEICHHQRAYFNLTFDPKDQATAFNHQIYPHLQGMSLGNKHVALISLIEQGEEVFHTKRYDGLDHPFCYPLTFPLEIPHVLITSIHIEDRVKKLRQLDQERKVLKSLGIFGNQESEIKEAEIEAFTHAIRVQGEAFVTLGLCVVLWHHTAEGLQISIDQTLAAFRECGSIPLVENIDTTNLFVANVPGSTAHHYRRVKMHGAAACAYLNFQGPYCSNSKGIRLSDRFGNPLQVALFNPNATNQNAIVVGPSGSGKSFFIGNLIIQRHEAS